MLLQSSSIREATTIWTPNTPMLNKDVRQGQKSTLFTWQDSKDGLSRPIYGRSRDTGVGLCGKHMIRNAHAPNSDEIKMRKMFPRFGTFLDPRYFRKMYDYCSVYTYIDLVSYLLSYVLFLY